MKTEEICKTCPSRYTCSSLCPEAELYASQDEVPQRELTVGFPVHGSWPKIRRPMKPLSETQRIVVSLILDGKSNEEICKSLEITKDSFRKQVSRIRKSLK